jgi:hypothetical protein
MGRNLDTIIMKHKVDIFLHVTIIPKIMATMPDRLGMNT